MAASDSPGPSRRTKIPTGRLEHAIKQLLETYYTGQVKLHMTGPHFLSHRVK